jgi:voltage-gated potassium channel
VILIWLTALNVAAIPIALTSGLLIFYLSFLVYSFARKLMEVRKCDEQRDLCGDLSLPDHGASLGGIYALLEDLQPGSFAGNLINMAGNSSEKSYFLNYFSFVTLSTPGYGDIAPQTREAAALCQMEAILGQFFSLVVVARLVGIQVAQEESWNT